MSAVRVALAGSSGSIGTQTLDVIRAEAGAYEVVALGAGRSADLLIEQANEFRPQVVAVADEQARRTVAAALPFCDVVADFTDLVEPADVVINGVVGFAGLDVTVATLRAGRRLGLANKESLIAAGPVVQPLRDTPGAEIVPVDSEHCALHQCLRSSEDAAREVARLVLTASGGPFRGRRADDLAAVTIDDALAHPTWSMGPKITIDSSTLMNKGLEVIEAHELFGTSFDQIDVVVHPQSVVHSMVEFSDGSTIAQLSMPDMRLPIGYALGVSGTASPHRSVASTGPGCRGSTSNLPTGCVPLSHAGVRGGRAAGAAPAWLSAANETAVDAFLTGRLRWNQIVDVCVATLDAYDGVIPGTVEDVIEADRQARVVAEQIISRIPHTKTA